MEIRTLEEQIASKCVHFDGVMNKTCRASVKYDSVRNVSTRPYQWPCFRDGPMSGGECPKCQFPSVSKVNEQVDRIVNSGKKIADAITDIKNHIQRTGIPNGWIICSNCDSNLYYTTSESNGHLHGKCAGCDISFME